jgi:hypothetical protein
MRTSAASVAAVIGSLFVSSAYSCLYFNATIEGDKISVYSWDDANNNDKLEPADIVCQGQSLAPVSENYWNVPCSKADNAKSDTLFEIFREPVTKRFLDVIYRYSNPNAQGLQEGKDANPDEFLFNFRTASVNGSFFKSREFCAQHDILELVLPQALKNPCDSTHDC